MQNIKCVANFLRTSSHCLPLGALEYFYRICEKAKELVENCCSEDWCKASTFQIQNEEAFKEVLLESSLCYNIIFEFAESILILTSNIEEFLSKDLRLTSTFNPPSSYEVLQDRQTLLKRYEDFINDTNVSNLCTRQLYLANYLTVRLYQVHQLRSNIEDIDVSTSRLWPADGQNLDGEWGKDSQFLGGNVSKTTWFDVPCAKKVFEDGVQEDVILAKAKILARLNHPNIVKFICCGHDPDNAFHFIAMEQMERGLHSVIRKQAQLKQGPPFPLLPALDIMFQIARGTCYLHENGIAHRDLKTSNVVVRQVITPYLQDYLHAKLVDFGLSKTKLTASKSSTISRPKIGTTVYMPPEAFHHGKANWFKADVYSFGILCSVILSGKEPFLDLQRSKIYESICNGIRPVLPPGTPKELERLIKSCWDSDRNVRPDFVDICMRLAELRHRLLSEDPENQGFRYETDGFGSSYIRDMIKRQSDARQQPCSHVQSQTLKNIIEVDEWFVDQGDPISGCDDFTNLQPQGTTMKNSSDAHEHDNWRTVSGEIAGGTGDRKIVPEGSFILNSPKDEAAGAHDKAKKSIEVRGRMYQAVRKKYLGKWVADIRLPKHKRGNKTPHKSKLWLETFNTAEKAALAYDTSASKVMGENARLNFPRPPMARGNKSHPPVTSISSSSSNQHASSAQAEMFYSTSNAGVKDQFCFSQSTPAASKSDSGTYVTAPTSLDDDTLFRPADSFEDILSNFLDCLSGRDRSSDQPLSSI